MVKTFLSYNIPSSWPFSLNNFEFFVVVADTRSEIKNRAGSKLLCNKIILCILILAFVLIASFPCTFDHNPLHFKENCVLLLMTELPRLFVSGSLAAIKDPTSFYLFSFEYYRFRIKDSIDLIDSKFEDYIIIVWKEL